jgi:microcystin degradation protein MlrC
MGNCSKEKILKIFTGCLGTETHTAAPLPTDMAAFETSHLVRGGAHGEPAHMFGAPLVFWREHAKALGWEVAEGLSAFATPSGVVVKSVYEALRDELLADLKAAMPVDGILLSMHGAMVADGYPSCEEDTLIRIREIAGPDMPIGVEFDLHCHITKPFIDAIDALVIYKEYPHTDFRERAEDLWRIMEGALTGKLKPKISVFDCRMLGCFHTTREPMRGFVDRMTVLEGKDGVLSVSLGHGFPWGDVPDEGARIVVVTDNAPVVGDRVAQELGRGFWDLRDDVTPRFLGLDEAVTEALNTPKGPAVIADMADNPGGGAPGDSTFIARRLLERGIGMAAVGGIWDPVAVGIACGAGEGATFRLRLGGKTGETSGPPLDLNVKVMRVLRDTWTISLGGSRRNLGDVAWLHAEGIDFVVHSVRAQNTTPHFFEAVGIDPTGYRLLVVKSMQHFHAGYAPIAEKIIYCAAPGTLEWDMSQVAHKHIRRPVWPIDDDPWDVQRPW